MFANIQQQYNSHLMALYRGQPGWAAPELSETLTQHTTFIFLKFLTNIPPSQASSSISGV